MTPGYVALFTTTPGYVFYYTVSGYYDNTLFRSISNCLLFIAVVLFFFVSLFCSACVVTLLYLLITFNKVTLHEHIKAYEH